MAKETLLNSDVAFGERVLKTLDTAGFPVPVALWLRKGDDETMKLLLVSPLYDKLGIREAYLKLLGALSGEKDRFRFSFRLTGTRDPLIRDLRKVYGKLPTRMACGCGAKRSAASGSMKGTSIESDRLPV
jgi:hypothetical protein